MRQEPARPDLWGARVSNDPGLPDYAAHSLAFVSLPRSDWALAYYRRQRARGHGHNRALRALGAKWLKIIFTMWVRQVPYEENHHLAMMARQQCRQVA